MAALEKSEGEDSFEEATKVERKIDENVVEGEDRRGKKKTWSDGEG